ncbi:phosphatase PAP2 family protein [Acidovorax sp. sic0104]|uniref:phosphatase PAP2 family protein n=1 Tax=Acidovorax sp. sic0104 TaxID=2854784 RepID=UPI001C476D66|nr:phosphatase PAP2 family protein [Acidovorax sp. sic0104]MBV7539809.1 phosphatase PAP2 family protein [Acidovorax sp. sic0104]
MADLDAATLGTLLAQHPLGWWVAGMAAGALTAWACLAGLRAARQAGPPLRERVPVQAHWLMLVAMAACAGMLVLAGAAIAELAESGHPGGAWGALDDALAADLRAYADVAVLQWFAIATHLGDSWALAALTVLVTALLWWRGHRLLAMGWLVAMAGNGALTRILKALFERVRPEHVHGIAQADGYSFPSGHSSASMTAYAMLAYLATRLLPRSWHLPAALLAGAAVFTTGWSRVVLQVHYASDVLAGWLLAATWMACTVVVMESVSRWRGARASAAGKA